MRSMKEIPGDDLAGEHVSMLRAYLASPDEAHLHLAYELGRRALSRDLGILQFAELHGEALAVILCGMDTSEGIERTLRMAKDFLLEALSPFEMAQRQWREASTSLRRLHETLEAEVKRVAHALHDEAAQLLVSADLAVNEVASELPAAVRGRMEKIRAPLRQCALELRRLSHELRPPILDDLGLVPALEFLAEGVSNRIGVPVTVVGSTRRRPSAAVETAVYRSVQEALSNVARHAHASMVVIEVVQTDAVLRCAIRDDGAGFDPSALPDRPEQRGLGLLAIRERLNAVGGSHTVVSEPGKGTALLVSIPLVGGRR